MIVLKDPWSEAQNPQAFVDQLEKEVGSAHYLSKFRGLFELIAKNESNDDVIFEIREFGYALVHLTWSSPQASENYPKYKLLPKDSDVQLIIDESHADY